MTKELAEKLQKAGFKRRGWPCGVSCSHTYKYDICPESSDLPFNPYLEELIEACGDRFRILEKDIHQDNLWRAESRASYKRDGENRFYGVMAEGATEVEAVANLWLKLNSKELEHD